MTGPAQMTGRRATLAAATGMATCFGAKKFNVFSQYRRAEETAVRVFPDEIDAAPRRWAARAYPTLIYYNTLNTGGLFAAWEQRQLFSVELRAAFKSLR